MTKIVELYLLGAIAFGIAISDGSTLTRDEIMGKVIITSIWPAGVVLAIGTGFEQ